MKIKLFVNNIKMGNPTTARKIALAQLTGFVLFFVTLGYILSQNFMNGFMGVYRDVPSNPLLDFAIFLYPLLLPIVTILSIVNAISLFFYVKFSKPKAGKLILAILSMLFSLIMMLFIFDLFRFHIFHS